VLHFLLQVFNADSVSPAVIFDHDTEWNQSTDNTVCYVLARIDFTVSSRDWIGLYRVSQSSLCVCSAIQHNTNSISSALPTSTADQGLIT